MEQVAIAGSLFLVSILSLALSLFTRTHGGAATYASDPFYTFCARSGLRYLSRSSVVAGRGNYRGHWLQITFEDQGQHSTMADIYLSTNSKAQGKWLVSKGTTDPDARHYHQAPRRSGRFVVKSESDDVQSKLQSSRALRRSLVALSHMDVADLDFGVTSDQLWVHARLTRDSVASAAAGDLPSLCDTMCNLADAINNVAA